MSTAEIALWGEVVGGGLEQEIQARGIAVIEHGIPTDVIDEVVQAHANFTDNHPEPELSTLNAMITDVSDLDILDFSADQQTEWHKYRSNLPSFAKPNGHTNRFAQATALAMFGRMKPNKKTGVLEPIIEDPKEFFHYYPTFIDRLTAQHHLYGWGAIPPEVVALAEKMHVVHDLAKQALQPVFARLEKTHPNLSQYITPEDLDVSPVRSLRYHHGQGDVLAGGHHDRSMFTMQVADSHRGLRFRNRQTGAMELVDTPPHVSPVFPAAKWKDAYPDSPFRSAWHDVINDPTACDGRPLYGENIARYAIIFFVNSKKIGEQASKDANHTEHQPVA